MTSKKLRKRWEHVKEKVAERNGVQRWLSRKTLPAAQSFGFSICGDHFYEPIPNLDLIRKTYVEQPRTLSAFSEDAAWESNAVDVLSPYLLEYLSSSALRTYGRNWYYTGWDAAYYYCLIRSRKPRKITEVGRGFSTLIAGAALEQNARESNPGELVSIDPYFRGDCATNHTRIVVSELQAVDAEQRQELLCADMLFIDSSHVLKWGSDVFHLFESWIPRVRVGTLIHIHDIFTPFDYPRSWMVEERRFWNEQYILESCVWVNN
jgi:hypothetical protein